MHVIILIFIIFKKPEDTTSCIPIMKCSISSGVLLNKCKWDEHTNNWGKLVLGSEYLKLYRRQKNVIQNKKYANLMNSLTVRRLTYICTQKDLACSYELPLLNLKLTKESKEQFLAHKEARQLPRLAMDSSHFKQYILIILLLFCCIVFTVQIFSAWDHIWKQSDNFSKLHYA